MKVETVCTTRELADENVEVFSIQIDVVDGTVTSHQEIVSNYTKVDTSAYNYNSIPISQPVT